jgi:hypothetical protein
VALFVPLYLDIVDVLSTWRNPARPGNCCDG